MWCLCILIIATVWLFDYKDFSGNVVISHCCLNLYFLMNSDAEYIFMSSLRLCWNFIKISAHFENKSVTYYRVLRILSVFGTNIFHQIYDLKYFLPVVSLSSFSFEFWLTEIDCNRILRLYLRMFMELIVKSIFSNMS